MYDCTRMSLPPFERGQLNYRDIRSQVHTYPRMSRLCIHNDRTQNKQDKQVHTHSVMSWQSVVFNRATNCHIFVIWLLFIAHCSVSVMLKVGRVNKRHQSVQSRKQLKSIWVAIIRNPWHWCCGFLLSSICRALFCYACNVLGGVFIMNWHLILLGRVWLLIVMSCA